MGLTGGLHRYTLGGFTDLACAISTTCEGLLGGLVHWRLMRAGKMDALFEPRIAFFTTLYAEIMQMVIILLVATPFDKSLLLVRTIATPMILANSCGAALFISMIRDQQQMYEKFSRVFSAKALNIANRTVGIMNQGFTPRPATRLPASSRRRPGWAPSPSRIPTRSSPSSASARITINLVPHYLGHHHAGYRPQQGAVCRRQQPALPLQHLAPVPARLGAGDPAARRRGVIGTIKLYEPKKRLFLKINHTLGKGLPTCSPSSC